MSKGTCPGGSSKYSRRGIQEIFSSLPSTYELINHILTLGFDNPVRRYAARIAAESNNTGNKKKLWLDVCTGTGEMAYYLSQHARDNALIVATDFTLPMLHYARVKRKTSNHFVLANSRRLPFKDNMFDLVTMSFATRNINTSRPDMVTCFNEYYRVLKEGGKFINLETSQPESKEVRGIFHLFIRAFVKPVGASISGSIKAYAYLSQTIPKFYNAPDLASILTSAGFEKVGFRRILGGAAAVHNAVKAQSFPSNLETTTGQGYATSAVNKSC